MLSEYGGGYLIEYHDWDVVGDVTKEEYRCPHYHKIITDNEEEALEFLRDGDE